MRTWGLSPNDLDILSRQIALANIDPKSPTLERDLINAATAAETHLSMRGNQVLINNLGQRLFRAVVARSLPSAKGVNLKSKKEVRKWLLDVVNMLHGMDYLNGNINPRSKKTRGMPLNEAERGFVIRAIAKCKNELELRNAISDARVEMRMRNFKLPDNKLATLSIIEDILALEIDNLYGGPNANQGPNSGTGNPNSPAGSAQPGNPNAGGQQNPAPNTGSGSATPGTGTGGGSQPNSGTPAPNVQPAQPPAGPSGTGANGGSGSPAAPGTGPQSGTGNGSPASSSGQRPSGNPNPAPTGTGSQQGSGVVLTAQERADIEAIYQDVSAHYEQEMSRNSTEFETMTGGTFEGTLCLNLLMNMQAMLDVATNTAVSTALQPTGKNVTSGAFWMELAHSSRPLSGTLGYWRSGVFVSFHQLWINTANTSSTKASTMVHELMHGVIDTIRERFPDIEAQANLGNPVAKQIVESVDTLCSEFKVSRATFLSYNLFNTYSVQDHGLKRPLSVVLEENIAVSFQTFMARNGFQHVFDGQPEAFRTAQNAFTKLQDFIKIIVDDMVQKVLNTANVILRFLGKPDAINIKDAAPWIEKMLGSPQSSRDKTKFTRSKSYKKFMREYITPIVDTLDAGTPAGFVNFFDVFVKGLAEYADLNSIDITNDGAYRMQAYVTVTAAQLAAQYHQQGMDLATAYKTAHEKVLAALQQQQTSNSVANACVNLDQTSSNVADAMQADASVDTQVSTDSSVSNVNMITSAEEVRIDFMSRTSAGRDAPDGLTGPTQELASSFMHGMFSEDAIYAGANSNDPVVSQFANSVQSLAREAGIPASRIENAVNSVLTNTEYRTTSELFNAKPFTENADTILQQVGLYGDSAHFNEAVTLVGSVQALWGQNIRQAYSYMAGVNQASFNATIRTGENSVPFSMNYATAVADQLSDPTHAQQSFFDAVMNGPYQDSETQSILAQHSDWYLKGIADTTVDRITQHSAYANAQSEANAAVSALLRAPEYRKQEAVSQVQNVTADPNMQVHAQTTENVQQAMQKLYGTQEAQVSLTRTKASDSRLNTVLNTVKGVLATDTSNSAESLRLRDLVDAARNDTGSDNLLNASNWTSVSSSIPGVSEVFMLNIDDDLHTENTDALVSEVNRINREAEALAQSNAHTEPYTLTQATDWSNITTQADANSAVTTLTDRIGSDEAVRMVSRAIELNNMTPFDALASIEHNSTVATEQSPRREIFEDFMYDDVATNTAVTESMASEQEMLNASHGIIEPDVAYRMSQECLTEEDAGYAMNDDGVEGELTQMQEMTARDRYANDIINEIEMSNSLADMSNIDHASEPWFQAWFAQGGLTDSNGDPAVYYAIGNTLSPNPSGDPNACEYRTYARVNNMLKPGDANYDRIAQLIKDQKYAETLVAMAQAGVDAVQLDNGDIWLNNIVDQTSWWEANQHNAQSNPNNAQSNPNNNTQRNLNGNTQPNPNGNTQPAGPKPLDMNDRTAVRQMVEEANHELTNRNMLPLTDAEVQAITDAIAKHYPAQTIGTIVQATLLTNANSSAQTAPSSVRAVVAALESARQGQPTWWQSNQPNPNGNTQPNPNGGTQPAPNQPSIMPGTQAGIINAIADRIMEQLDRYKNAADTCRKQAQQASTRSLAMTAPMQAGWWHRMATQMRKLWAELEADFRSWTQLNLGAEVGAAETNPMYMAYTNMRQLVHGARVQINERLAPMQQWFESVAKTLGDDPLVVATELGKARTMLHVIEAAERQHMELQQALVDAYMTPEQKPGDRAKAIRIAENNLKDYEDAQNGATVVDPKTGEARPIYPLYGGITVAKARTEYDNIVNKYGEDYVRESVYRMGETLESVITLGIEQGVLSQADVANFGKWQFYCPLITKTQYESGVQNDVISLFAPKMNYHREGAHTPAVDSYTALTYVSNRMANNIGSVDFGNEAYASYQHLEELYNSGSPDVVASEVNIGGLKGTYYNGLIMMPVDRLSAIANNKNRTYDGAAVQQASEALHNAATIIRVLVSDPNDPNAPQRTQAFAVWFNNKELKYATTGDGKKVTMESHERQQQALSAPFHRTVKGKENVLDKAGHMLRKATSSLASLSTTYKPAFPIINMIRDTWERGFFINDKVYRDANGNAVSGTTVLKHFAKNMMHAPTVMRCVLTGKTEGISGYLGQYLQEFKDLGIMSSASLRAMLKDSDRMTYAYLEQVIQKVQKGSSITEAIKTLGKRGRGIAHTYSEMFYAVPIFATYMSMRECGMGTREAMYNATELANMGQRGQLARGIIGACFPFVPSIGQTAAQLVDYLGLSSMAFGQGVQSQKIHKRAIKAYSVLAGTSIAISFMLPAIATAFGDGDDEEGKKFLDSLPIDSFTSLPIPLGDNDYLKLPLGFGILPFATQLAIGCDRLRRGVADVPTVARSLISSFINNISPVGGPTFQCDSVEDFLDKLVMTVTPSVAAGIVQVGVNKDFWGNDIRSGYPQEDELKAYSDRRRTPEVYKTIAKNIYDTFHYDVAPETVRNLANSYLQGPLQAIVSWIEQDPLSKDPEYKSTRDELGPWLTALGTTSLYATKGNTLRKSFYDFNNFCNNVIKNANLHNALVVHSHDLDPATGKKFTAVGKRRHILTLAGFDEDFIDDYCIQYTLEQKLKTQSKNLKQEIALARSHGAGEARLGAIVDDYFYKEMHMMQDAMDELAYTRGKYKKLDIKPNDEFRLTRARLLGTGEM